MMIKMLRLRLCRLRQRRRQNDALSNYRIFPRPGPKLYTAVIWYAFGLYVLFVALARRKARLRRRVGHPPPRVVREVRHLALSSERDPGVLAL